MCQSRHNTAVVKSCAPTRVAIIIIASVLVDATSVRVRNFIALMLLHRGQHVAGESDTSSLLGPWSQGLLHSLIYGFLNGFSPWRSDEVVQHNLSVTSWLWPCPQSRILIFLLKHHLIENDGKRIYLCPFSHSSHFFKQYMR
jgi:hypothetical protein